jgi:hypothetical protein
MTKTITVGTVHPTNGKEIYENFESGMERVGT